MKDNPTDRENTFRAQVTARMDNLATMLIEKNEAYGDSALNPVRVFSNTDPAEQIRVRIDDKLSRIQRGHDYGGEDTIRDLIGYLVLLLIATEDEPRDTATA